MRSTGLIDVLIFEYTNYRGEESTREVVPDQVYYGTTEWHPDHQWFMHGYDVNKDEFRDFAMRDIKNMRNGADK